MSGYDDALRLMKSITCLEGTKPDTVLLLF